MAKNHGSFKCPKCSTVYRTQEEADRCGARLESRTAYQPGDIVRYTFFSVRPVGRDMPEDFNRWRVLDPAMALAPDSDGGHQHLVQVEQIELKRGSKTKAVHVFPESELI